MHSMPMFIIREAVEKKWQSSERAHLSPLWPGFDFRTWCHMCVMFFVGPHPCSKVFLPDLYFSSLHKNQHSKFQFDLETLDKKSQLVEFPVLNPVSFLFYDIYFNTKPTKTS